MSELTEAEVVAALTRTGTDPQRIEPGEVFTVVDGGGQIRILDTDAYAAAPRRTTAHRKVNTSGSFVHYLEKHGTEQTEVYADSATHGVTAVIDSHEGTDKPAGWQQHLVTLELQKSKSWEQWNKFDGRWFSQIEFAEFIEQRAADVVKPTAGDLMQLAQDFYMTKGVEFQSTQRLENGESSIVYKEKIITKGNGEMTVPKEIELVLQPYVGGPWSAAVAAFRTRLNGAELQVSYVLIRPEDIIDGIFTDLVVEIITGRAADLEKGLEPLTGIRHPVYFGKRA